MAMTMQGGKTKRETEFLETVNNTSAEAKMAADWVEDCIESGSTLTVPTPNFGEQPMLAMQFLNVQKKIVVLPSFRGDTSRQHVWNVQPLSIYKLDELPSPLSHLDVFSFGDPQTFNIVKFLTEAGPERTSLREWDTDFSDVEGCTTLVSGRALVPRSSLQSATVPVLALTDSLEKSSYIPVQRTVEHYPAQGNFFDSRCVQSKRCYLQAVLAARTLFAKGQRSFLSNRPQAYYLAIMRKPCEISAKLSGVECLKFLKDSEGPVATLALPAPTQASNKRKLALADLVGDDGEAPPVKKVSIDGPGHRARCWKRFEFVVEFAFW